MGITNTLEIGHGQRSRETMLAEMALEFFPDLYLHSRAGKGMVRTCLPRLRFDRRRNFRWLFRLFSGRPPLPQLVITGSNNRALELGSEWTLVEIHCYNAGHSKTAERFTSAYQNETGCPALVILEPVAEPSRWRPLLRFLMAATAMSGALIGLRLLSMLIFRSFFANFF